VNLRKLNWQSILSDVLSANNGFQEIGKFIDVVNPATEAVVGGVPVASPEEIDLAVKTAGCVESLAGDASSPNARR
jgi:acyl-CoA reductase-like NAD-dependent aldehyde dehydrogenase